MVPVKISKIEVITNIPPCGDFVATPGQSRFPFAHNGANKQTTVTYNVPYVQLSDSSASPTAFNICLAAATKNSDRKMAYSSMEIKANAFGLATCASILFRYDRKHTYNAFVKGIFIWAALLSISRIFVGKHYLGDITVGAMIGCGYGALVAMAARWFFARFIDKIKIPSPGKATGNNL